MSEPEDKHLVKFCSGCLYCAHVSTTDCPNCGSIHFFEGDDSDDSIEFDS